MIGALFGEVPEKGERVAYLPKGKKGKELPDVNGGAKG